MSGVRRSLFYAMAGSYVGLPLQLAGTMIMSRLLTPQQIGVFAVAAVFASFASSFRDFGVGEYLIQEKELDADKLRAALTVNIAISWFIGLVLFGAAPFAAAFYGDAGVAEVMRVQSLSFLLIPFGAVTMANFRRELNFHPIFCAGLLSNIVTFVVSIACAFYGMGYMSLAWSSLAGVVVTVAVSMWFRPRDFPRWPGLRGVRRVFDFGKFASGVYIFAQLGRGAPEMIIGRAEGLADVAIFSRGNGLVELFNRLVLQAVHPICQPLFAKGNRDEGSAAHGYLLTLSYLTAVGWPTLFFLGLASLPAVMVLYGEQWVHSAALARVLCAAAAVELVHSLATEALLAVGEARRANALQMLMQGARIAGLLAVVPFGLEGACWGLLAAGFVGLAFAQRAMHAAMGLRWSDLLASCGKSALVALGTAAPLALWYLYEPPNQHNYLRWLPVAAVLAMLAWTVSLRAVAHPFWAEVAAVARMVAGRNHETVQAAAMNVSLVDDLAHEAARQFSGADVALEGPISVRDNSLVFRARVGGVSRRDMAVKCCRDMATGQVDIAEAKYQFDALQRVDAALRPFGPRFGVPAPLFFSERLGAYGMAWVDGESLTARMGRKAALASLPTAFERTGAWLGTLHRSGQVRRGAADIAGKLEHLETMRDRPVDHPAFRRGIEVLAGMSCLEACGPLSISWLHGDCKTDNFMLLGDGVFGIDISLRHENSVEHDLAQFLNHFDLLALRLRFRHLRAAAPALREAFMAGYRGTGPAVSLPFLHWIRLRSALTLWHNSIYDHPPAWPKRWLLNRIFSSLVGGLVDERQAGGAVLSAT